MPLTLFITGALAPKAMERQLAQEKGDMVVLEYDTLLDRSRYPQVREWLKTADFVCYQEIEAMRGQVAQLMSHFLKHRPELGDLPGDSAMRRAALQGSFQDSCFTYILNSKVRDCLWARFAFDRIVLTPGSGVNFEFWRGVAATGGLELVVLEPEWHGRSLARRFERWRYKRINKARAAQASAIQPQAPRPVDGLPLAVCVSRRMTHLLQLETQAPGFRIISASLADLGTPDAALLAHEKERFSTWWKAWKQTVLSPACIEGAEPSLAPFQGVFERMGIHYTEQVYPRWAALKKNAMAWLERHRPALIIADMQINEEEVIWCLAASEMGIPVAAYTYDCLVDPLITYCPDFLLIDGARGMSRVLRAGYPTDRLIDVRCHRIPVTPPRTESEIEAHFTNRRPFALCADTMSMINDPQASLRLYQTLVAAARRLPGIDFAVKYHPLRTPKSEERSFLGMDETEVQIKTRFIRSLRPPANFHILPPEASMEECLKKTSILINTISLTGQEAFHIGIPVIFMSRHEPDSIIFPNMEAWMKPLYVDTADELVAAMSQLVESREFRHAQIAQQHHYQQQYYWASQVTLTDGINEAARRAKQMPLYPP
jgi:hypothetical protein